MIKKIKDNKFLKLMIMIFKAILSLLIILVISIIFIQRISHNKLSLGGYGIYTIITESMVPKYNVYDMILAKEIDPKEIKKGDDVVYVGEKDDFAGKIVTHQVINIDQKNGKKFFHTKGIANDIEDPIISEDQVKGKVVMKSSILSFISIKDNKN